MLNVRRTTNNPFRHPSRTIADDIPLLCKQAEGRLQVLNVNNMLNAI